MIVARDILSTIIVGEYRVSLLGPGVGGDAFDDMVIERCRPDALGDPSWVVVTYRDPVAWRLALRKLVKTILEERVGG